MDELRVSDGARVADLGAGSGWFTLRLSRRVGPNGRVYAEDIQPQMIEAIGRRMQHEGRSNVVTVLGTPHDPKLPERLDAVLIMGSFPELEDPVTLLTNVGRSLAPHGLVGIVDFTPGGGGPGPGPDERVDPETVIRAATGAGLQLLKREAVPPFLFLLVFGRDPSRGVP
jgi:ubiquinone/menaquinone biosynthesis C-methylase UbiE